MFYYHTQATGKFAELAEICKLYKYCTGTNVQVGRNPVYILYIQYLNTLPNTGLQCHPMGELTQVATPVCHVRPGVAAGGYHNP